jgi:hypothetical protein
MRIGQVEAVYRRLTFEDGQHNILHPPSRANIEQRAHQELSNPKSSRFLSYLELITFLNRLAGSFQLEAFDIVPTNILRLVWLHVRSGR